MPSPALKRLLEAALARAGPAALARRASAGRTLVLAYHNIVPSGERGGADASLHLPQRRFAEQLEVLAGSCDVVPLTEVLGEAPASTGRPRVIITFDDGALGALTAGVEELRRCGLPATFFVTPGRLGRQAFWWDRLGSPEHGEVPEPIRRHALTALRGEDEAILAWAGREGIRVTDVPECATTATEAELAAALTIPGLSVGAHSWSHPNLAALDSSALEAELSHPLAWLQARWPLALPVVSYPYGLCSPAVTAAAARSGYQAGLLITGGWVAPRRGLTGFLEPRLNVSAGVSRDGYVLRVSGLLRR
jgi:peptidoglycan/xylan/chitin deacetylase (PgdA/CDA1 family)